MYISGMLFFKMKMESSCKISYTLFINTRVSICILLTQKWNVMKRTSPASGNVNIPTVNSHPNRYKVRF